MNEVKTGSKEALEIRRLTHGGYVICQPGGMALQTVPLFACSNISTALEFIRKAMATEDGPGDTVLHKEQAFTFQRNAQLRAALKPFAEFDWYTANYPPIKDDNARLLSRGNLTYGDLRRARTALGLDDEV